MEEFFYRDLELKIKNCIKTAFAACILHQNVNEAVQRDENVFVSIRKRNEIFNEFVQYNLS